MQIRDVLGLSPELWVGVLVDYNTEFQTAFKKMVELRAYDPTTRAWWFPVSYLTFVKQLAREHKAAPDDKLEQAHQVIQAELNRRQFLKVNTDVDGKLNATIAADYATLGLQPSVPRVLIEWAIIFWRKELGAFGAPTTELLLKEEAYRRICAPPDMGRGSHG